MRVFNFLKFLAIMGFLGAFAFFYTLFDVNPPKVIESSLEKVRPTAFFLNLNEDVLNEISKKKNYPNLEDMPKEKAGKDSLFQDMDKQDYNF